jgi:hypothetical protein
MLDAYAEVRGAVVGGEKTPTHFRYVGRLLSWFPDARVVFVMRDVRGVVASLQRLDYPWAQRSDYMRIKLWRDAAQAALRWQADPRVEVVRFEDLVADPIPTVQELASTLTGDVFDCTWIREAILTDPASSWASVLSKKRAAVVAWAAEPMMTRLGYVSATEPLPARARLQYRARGLRDEVGRLRRAAKQPVQAMRRIRYRRGALRCP